MPELWFNAWEKAAPHPITGKPAREVRIESEALASYDDAMQELEDYADSWRRHGFNYYGTYQHTLDAKGKNAGITFHDDLMDDLEAWIREKEADAKAYREAATLSAHQLCDVGRRAW